MNLHRRVANELSEYQVTGSENFSSVEREAARTALLTNIPQTFEFTGKRYVIEPKEAAGYFSKSSLREYIKQMRKDIGLLAGAIFRFKQEIRRETAFAKKIHGKNFKV